MSVFKYQFFLFYYKINKKNLSGFLQYTITQEQHITIKFADYIKMENMSSEQYDNFAYEPEDINDSFKHANIAYD